jgi:hypothetical protein
LVIPVFSGLAALLLAPLRREKRRMIMDTDKTAYILISGILTATTAIDKPLPMEEIGKILAPDFEVQNVQVIYSKCQLPTHIVENIL